MKKWRKQKSRKSDGFSEDEYPCKVAFAVGIRMVKPCNDFSTFDDLSIYNDSNSTSSLPSLCDLPRKTSEFDTIRRPFDKIRWKAILLGDSGVGKTSLLVQYGSKKFKPGSFDDSAAELAFMVMLVGDSGVGKTCLLIRFRDGYFLSGNFISTVGIDFRTRVVEVDDTKVKLNIWDTAGQERFKSVTHSYYREADALLLVYDVTNLLSFENTRAWLDEIGDYAQDDVVIMLLGNKVDCDYDRMVQKEEGERLAREYNAIFMETSAKTGQNVDLVFLAIARELKARKIREPERSSFNVNDYVREKTRKSRCPHCHA